MSARNTALHVGAGTNGRLHAPPGFDAHVKAFLVSVKPVNPALFIPDPVDPFTRIVVEPVRRHIMDLLT